MDNIVKILKLEIMPEFASELSKVKPNFARTLEKFSTMAAVRQNPQLSLQELMQINLFSQSPVKLKSWEDFLNFCKSKEGISLIIDNYSVDFTTAPKRVISGWMINAFTSFSENLNIDDPVQQEIKGIVLERMKSVIETANSLDRGPPDRPGVIQHATHITRRAIGARPHPAP